METQQRRKVTEARQIALWSIGLTLVLVCAYLIGAHAVPLWRTHLAVQECTTHQGDVLLDRDGSYYIHALGGPQEAARKLDSYLALPAVSNELRQSAVSLMSDCGECAVDVLMTRTRDRDVRVRMTAIVGLWRIGPPAHRAVPVLLEALTDTEEVRPSDSERSLPIRAASIAALGSVGASDESVLDALVTQLEDKDARIVVETCWALSRMGPCAKRALPAVEPLTCHPSQDVRDAAREVCRSLRGE